MKKLLIFFIIFLFTACGTIPKLNQENRNNYITTGFLDQHHYQITLKILPDKKAKGLVNQRESAILKARVTYKKKILTILTAYILDKNSDSIIIKSNLKIPANIQSGLKRLLNNGKIIEEYYEDDNSAVIVFRIKKYKLQEILDSYKKEMNQQQ